MITRVTAKGRYTSNAEIIATPSGDFQPAISPTDHSALALSMEATRDVGCREVLLVRWDIACETRFKSSIEWILGMTSVWMEGIVICR